MTNKQIAILEHRMEVISAEMEALEDIIDKRQARGKDTEGTCKRLDELSAKLGGMMAVLGAIGYWVDWEITDSHDIPHIVKK